MLAGGGSTAGTVGLYGTCHVGLRDRSALRSYDRVELERRFWSKVDKSGGPDMCWPWTAGVTSRGYGRFKVEGRHRQAHAVAFLLAGGELPGELIVRHLCPVTNNRCCNPSHLASGTQLENMADKARMGRQPKGENSGSAKLTTADVVAIRAARASGRLLADIAAEYGVTFATISEVCLFKTWRHLAASPEARP